MDLAGGNFWPVPNVSSRAVLMTKKKNFPECKNPQLFLKMIRQIFSLRRKTIKNNLSRFISAQQCDLALENAKINPSERAEKIELEKLLELSDIINSIIME